MGVIKMATTIPGPITIGPNMTDKDREKLKKYVNLPFDKVITKVKTDEVKKRTTKKKE